MVEEGDHTRLFIWMVNFPCQDNYQINTRGHLNCKQAERRMIMSGKSALSPHTLSNTRVNRTGIATRVVIPRL